METPQKVNPGDVVKAAVAAAGGRRKIADRFNITEKAVGAWVTRRYVPGEYVRPLSAMGGNVVTVDALLAVAEARAQERAAA